MKLSGYALGWLAATILVTAATWAVVGAASDEVSDSPGAPVISATTSTNPNSSSSSTTPDSSTSSSLPVSTTVPGGSSTSTSSGGSSSTTATSESGAKTVSSAGGTVTVTYSNGDVFLTGATPAVGYSMEIEDAGPDKVRVDFDSGDNEISVRIEWKDGQLDIEIDD